MLLGLAAPASAGTAAADRGRAAHDHAETTGGAAFGERPAVRPSLRAFTCVRGCEDDGGARSGSVLRLRGRGLDGVQHVTFHGAPGSGDDVRGRARPRSARTLVVRVPRRAVTGPLSAWVDARLGSSPSARVEIAGGAGQEPAQGMVAPASPGDTSRRAAPEDVLVRLRPAAGPSAPGAPRIETALSAPRTFYGSPEGITFAYRVSSPGPVEVQLALVHTGDGRVVQRWPPASVTPGQPQSVKWDGGSGGAAAPEGRYAFRLSARGAGGAQAHSAQAADAEQDAFDLHGHVFPIRERHDYGGASARFGTARSGRGHQGQDVFARCGSPLRAARGGVVKFKQYHAAAGHYLVIDGDGTTLDYAYMHLQAPSAFRAGHHVATGEQIGLVGDSGNASGCHLHFEMWSAPGWYDGGRPLDPFPHLKAWDAVS